MRITESVQLQINQKYTHTVVTYLIDDPLDEVKLSLQRGIQQEGQRVELHPEAVARALRVWLLQVGALVL